MGRKSNLRDRPYAREAASVQCQRCGKRIGLLWAVADSSGLRYDGHWLHGAVDTQFGQIIEGTKTPMMPNGFKDLANEDWLSVTCKRCDHNWQGRERDLYHLLAGSPGGTVRLGEDPQPEPGDWRW